MGNRSELLHKCHFELALTMEGLDLFSQALDQSRIIFEIYLEMLGPLVADTREVQGLVSSLYQHWDARSGDPVLRRPAQGSKGPARRR